MKFRVIAALLLCLLMCGCSATASVENLLMPPKLLAEQDEIYTAWVRALSSNIRGAATTVPRS